MSEHLNEIIIPKEEAVFHMDGNGRWVNRHGPFEHKKIIDHFNRSIRKDDAGYHVCQVRDNVIEKVYFDYEDTPLFVFDVIMGDPVFLLLNSGTKIKLNPEGLFTKKDQLFQREADTLVKFTERAMMALAGLMEEKEDRLTICLDNRVYDISEH